MEMPPLRPFVFLLTLLGVFAILVSTVPANFFVAEQEFRQAQIEEYFEAIDLQQYAETWLYCMNETGGKMLFGVLYQVDIDIGNRNFDLYYSKANYTVSTHPYVYVKHFYTTWWIFTDSHYMDFYNNKGILRSGDYLPSHLVPQEYLESDYPEQMPYSLKCSHFEADIYFGYNETTYSTLQDAWNHHGLHVLVGIDWDDMQTGLNAWNLITMMFWFQLPQIHPVLNFILGLALWTSTAYVIACIVIAFIKSLPFT